MKKYEQSPEVKIWLRNWRRAVWVTRWLRFLPYVRMIGLNGSLATGSWHLDSDIDFYIVLREDRLLYGRILVTFLVQLLGLRRHAKLEAGRICLNRYAVTSYLEIKPPNNYHARVFSKLIPLYSAQNVYFDFVLANQWMKDFGYPVRELKPLLEDSFLQSRIKHFEEWILDLLAGNRLEELFFNWQTRRSANDRRITSKSRVVISKQELCFQLEGE
jgi:predicted nucleotidyltransferase